jgi:hypothetical protein
VLCVLCGSFLLLQKQNNHREHREHRAEKRREEKRREEKRRSGPTEVRQQDERQLRSMAGGVASRDAGS